MPGRLKDARLRLHVACEPGWRDAVVAAAAAEGESLSAYVRTAVDARLKPPSARRWTRRAGNCAAFGRRDELEHRLVRTPREIARRHGDAPGAAGRLHHPANLFVIAAAARLTDAIALPSDSGGSLSRGLGAPGGFRRAMLASIARRLRLRPAPRGGHLPPVEGAVDGEQGLPVEGWRR